MTASTQFNPKDLAEELARLPEEDRIKLLAEIPDRDVIELLYDWDIWAREKQRIPDWEWFGWLLLTGRGFGKTRTGAETTRRWVEQARDTNIPIQIALVAETAADARDVLVEGESGLLAKSHPSFVPLYEPSKRRVTWPDGSVGILFAGQEPDQLRGPQFHKAWVDELAKYQYPQETWDNLELALRLGSRPQVIITTTPKPLPIIKQLIADPMVHKTYGTLYENRANLAPSFVKRVLKKYAGTRLGKQEIEGLLLEDVQGSMWTWQMIENSRAAVPKKEDWIRAVVAVDPSVSANKETSDEVGITLGVLALDPHTNKKCAYLLKDESGVLSANEWAKRTVNLYKKNHCDRIVGEVNNGGDLVEVNIRTVDQNVHFRAVRASRGKHVRAEPISGLYEQGLVKHCGTFSELEQQLTFFTREKYVGNDSPDRAESWIWNVTDLLLGPGGEYDPDRWDSLQQ